MASPNSSEARGEALARAAEGLVGCRFRLRGRDPATGLDCVGVVAAALEAAGLPARLPLDYQLRVRDPSRFMTHAAQFGFARVDGPAGPGDVLLLHVGPCQYHFIMAAGDGGFIHAHAGLRRVIHSGTRPAGTVAGHWRLAAQD